MRRYDAVELKHDQLDYAVFDFAVHKVPASDALEFRSIAMQIAESLVLGQKAGSKATELSDISDGEREGHGLMASLLAWLHLNALLHKQVLAESGRASTTDGPACSIGTRKSMV
jgi:hypothetical protein